MVFKESFKGGSRKFQGCCFKKVSWVSFGRYIWVFRGDLEKKFTGCLMEVLFLGCLKQCLRVSKRNFKGALKQHKGCFKDD